MVRKLLKFSKLTTARKNIFSNVIHISRKKLIGNFFIELCDVSKTVMKESTHFTVCYYRVTHAF